MSTAALERPSPTGIATRHAVSARLQSLRPVEPPCGQEPFDDLAVVFPSPRLGCTAATTLARRRTLGFDARASVTAWLIGAGLEALDPDRRQNVIEGWNAYRDHGPRLVGDGGCDVRLGRGGVGARERAALLEWLPLTDRELARLRGRPVRGRTHPRDRAARASADDLGPRRGDRAPSGCSRAERASRPSGSPRSSAMRTGGSGAEHLARLRRVGRQNRGAAAGGRAPGCERDRRLRLRARRRRRRPRAERSSPASSRDTPRVRSSQRALENPAC